MYLNGVVTAFDCLEFNANLRWIDTQSELAFLLMDLDARDRQQAPSLLDGRRVGVNRGYTVTTGVWARGVLQDVHWSLGYVGYFPTYVLGSIVSAQIWEAARRAMAAPPAADAATVCCRWMSP